MERFLLICLGGAVGTALRYLTSGVAARWFGADFPYGTFIVNIVGSFLIGVIQQVGTTSLLISDTTRLFLAVGIMPGKSATLTYRMTVDTTGMRARVTVVVEPDAFYVAFFETLLGQGAGRGEAQIRQALEAARRSPFTVFERDVPLS